MAQAGGESGHAVVHAIDRGGGDEAAEITAPGFGQIGHIARAFQRHLEGRRVGHAAQGEVAVELAMGLVLRHIARADEADVGVRSGIEKRRGQQIGVALRQEGVQTMGGDDDVGLVFGGVRRVEGVAASHPFEHAGEAPDTRVADGELHPGMIGIDAVTPRRIGMLVNIGLRRRGFGGPGRSGAERHGHGG